MTTIQQHRIEATLNKLMNYPEGIMTRKQWLNVKKYQNCTAKKETESKIKYNRAKFNRMDHYEQQKYEAKMKETKECFYLYEADGCSYQITKIEFNYFNTL